MSQFLVDVQCADALDARVVDVALIEPEPEFINVFVLPVLRMPYELAPSPSDIKLIVPEFVTVLLAPGLFMPHVYPPVVPKSVTLSVKLIAFKFVIMLLLPLLLMPLLNLEPSDSEIVPEFVTVGTVLVMLSGPIQSPVLLEFAVHDCE